MLHLLQQYCIYYCNTTKIGIILAVLVLHLLILQCCIYYSNSYCINSSNTAFIIATLVKIAIILTILHLFYNAAFIIAILHFYYCNTTKIAIYFTMLHLLQQYCIYYCNTTKIAIILECQQQMLTIQSKFKVPFVPLE